MNNKLNRKKHSCNLCGHEWTSRKAKPLSCPRCKRYDYNETISSAQTTTERIQELMAEATRPVRTTLNLDDDTDEPIMDGDMDPISRSVMYQAREKLKEIQEKHPEYELVIPSS